MKRPHESPECRCPGCQASDALHEQFIKAAELISQQGGKPDCVLVLDMSPYEFWRGIEEHWRKIREAEQ